MAYRRKVRMTRRHRRWLTNTARRTHRRNLTRRHARGGYRI